MNVSEFRIIDEKIRNAAKAERIVDINWYGPNTIGFVSLLSGDEDDVLIPFFDIPQLALCAKKGKAYGVDEVYVSLAQKFISNKDIEYTSEFYKTDKNESYGCIVLAAYEDYADPVYSYALYEYLCCAEQMLKDGGKLILISDKESVSTFTRTIIEENPLLSLDASVFFYKNCVTVFKKGTRSKTVYLRSANREPIDIIYEEFLACKGGFNIPYFEVLSDFKLNPVYYDPKNQNTVILLNTENARRLGDIADIIQPVLIPVRASQLGTDKGGYLII